MTKNDLNTAAAAPRRLVTGIPKHETSKTLSKSAGDANPYVGLQSQLHVLNMLDRICVLVGCVHDRRDDDPTNGESQPSASGAKVSLFL